MFPDERSLQAGESQSSSAPVSSGVNPARTSSPIGFHADGIPDELKCADRWVAFRLTAPKQAGEKHRKLPVDPKSGRNASSTDPKTWAPFERAQARVHAAELAGVGFVFNGDGICGIDLDQCRDPATGAITSEAQWIVDELNSFTEVSPSGTGLHIYVRARLPVTGRRKGWVEMYETGRFFTVTGVRVPGTPAGVEERQAAVEAVHARFIATTSPAKVERPTQASDDVLLDRARKAGNGAKFSALWDGKDDDYPSASEADLALCSILSHWARGDAPTVDRLFRRSKRMRPKWDEPHGKGTFGEMTIAKAVTPGQGRVARIEVLPGQLPEAVRAAHDLLLRVSPPQVFQRDRLLARLIRLPDAEEVDAVRRPKGAMSLHTLDEPYLLLRLAELAEWYAPRRGGLTRVDPHRSIALSLLADVGNWRFPPMLGFVEAPTLRKDGSILDRAGYDEASRLFLDTCGIEFGHVPRNPSREDAERALAILKAPFAEFPFVGESDYTTLIAAILTALVRRSLVNAPMFLFDARTMSTGKTLLVDSVSLIATGRTCAVTTQGQDETEDKKRILSILLQGDLVACIDNIDRPLEGPDYCVVLTERVYQGRVLGVSKMAKLPSKTLWLATGNNLVVKGDLITRVVLCDLDAKCEAPETRPFDGDLREQILANRPELVRAALTILRAFVVAGRPKQNVPVFGRFEKWSEFVREPLVWLGMQDPLKGTVRLRNQDPVLSSLRALTQSWRAAFGKKAKSVGKAVAYARQHPESDLAEALTELAGYGRDGIDARAVGVFLRQHRGRIVNGLRFETRSHAQGVAQWVVVGEMVGMVGPSLPPRGGTDVSDSPADARTCTHARTHEGADGIPPSPPVASGDDLPGDAGDGVVSDSAEVR